MLKILPLLFICCIFFMQLNAQTISRQVTLTSGSSFSGGDNSVSWTMGEIANKTYSSLSITLTQGFQQPNYLVISGFN